MAISRTPGAWPAAPAATAAQPLADPGLHAALRCSEPTVRRPLRSSSMRIFVAPDIIASPPKGPAMLREGGPHTWGEL